MQGQEQAIAKTRNVKPKWQERFAFFDTYGPPSSKEYTAALKALPFRKKLLIGGNIIAFFFGFIYMFVLGLWRKNLSILGIILGISVVEIIFTEVTGIEIPKALDTGFGVAISVMYSITVNYAYYLKEVKGSQSWNPFEGIRMI